MVERDNIGRAFVPKVLPVYPGHFPGANQLDAQFDVPKFQFGEQGGDDLFECAHIDLRRSLAIGEAERGSVEVLKRSSGSGRSLRTSGTSG
jgi:hypothetical protein